MEEQSNQSKKCQIIITITKIIIPEKSSTLLIGFPGGVRPPTPSTAQHQVFVPGTDKKEKSESRTAYPLITQTQLQINISMSTHNGHLCRIHTPGDSLVIKANVLLSLRNDAVHSVSGFGVKFDCLNKQVSLIKCCSLGIWERRGFLREGNYIFIDPHVAPPARRRGRSPWRCDISFPDELLSPC